jgi:hypothetical protein
MYPTFFMAQYFNQLSTGTTLHFLLHLFTRVVYLAQISLYSV